MSLWSVEDIVTASEGTLEQKGTRSADGVGTDSRTDLKGQIFFALKGENFDGHEFAGQAAEKGASVIIIDKKILKIPSDVSVIKVDDTLNALQRFSTWHRKKWNGKIIALTGSNGKTTTKEFAAHVLSQKFPVLSTEGNLNNHVGVPLTLLKLRPHHKFGIIEMGMNHSGELAALTQIAVPDIVLVTNVGRAHLEYFGTVEKIARAKEEIYETAPLKATRIFNMDNSYTGIMRARAPGGCRIITYSSYEKGVEVSLKEKVLTLEYVEVSGQIGGEPGQVKIPSFGRQQVANAMAASSIGLACGVEPPLIWKGLAECRSGWGRSQIVETASGAKVLFDAYNANPDSCAVAFENFSLLAVRGKKYVVFGDMLELGTDSKSFHEEAGYVMAQAEPTAVLVLGEYAEDVERGLKRAGFKRSITISKVYEEKLARSFGGMLQTGDVVLVKGSRGMKLEQVVNQWAPLNFS